MGKKDKRKSEGDDGENEDSWSEKIQHLNAIANPIASKKLTKRLYKIVKKGKIKKICEILYVTYHCMHSTTS